MPYRRLPKTDKARLKSLEAAIRMESMPINEIPVSFGLLTQAKTYLPVFETLVDEYTYTYDAQVSQSKKYQNIVKSARMYVSHFIQVLNFAVQRGELKKEIKEMYGLDPEDFTVPNLMSDSSLMEWGKKIIDGEQKRISGGGIPLSFPTIAKVKVYYDIFCEAMVSQQTRRQSTSRNQQNVAKMRQQIDDLILQIWNSVEEYYSELLPYAKYKACVNCGVIYYYRKGEEKLTPKTDEDIQIAEKSTLSIPFRD